MNLKPLRQQIDRIDEKILQLLNKRLDLARKVAQAKAQNGGALFVPEREAEQLKKLTPSPKSKLEAHLSFEPIFREILSCSRALQAALVGRGAFRIGYTGKPGCHAHQLAREQFGAHTTYLSYASEKAALLALARKKCDFLLSSKKPAAGL